MFAEKNKDVCIYIYDKCVHYMTFLCLIRAAAFPKASPSNQRQRDAGFGSLPKTNIY